MYLVYDTLAMWLTMTNRLLGSAPLPLSDVVHFREKLFCLRQTFCKALIFYGVTLQKLQACIFLSYSNNQTGDNSSQVYFEDSVREKLCLVKNSSCLKDILSDSR